MNINPEISLAEQHKAAAMVVVAWLMREIPVFSRWVSGILWPKLVAIYPYCRDNGGVKGIIRNFFAGQPKPETAAKTL